MGKTGKWIKSFLIGGKKDYSKDKDKDKCNSNHSSSTALITTTAEKPATPIVIPAPTTPKEKKRWSFRRSSATAPTSKDSTPTKPTTAALEPRYDQDKHAVGPVPPAATPTTATETAEPAQVMAAAPVDHLNPTCENTSAEEDTAAAIKIQSMYRSYLARKALRALRGLVKLQALVRGHLVRKQATATLRCMQALVTAQARARAHRIRSGGEDGKPFHHHRPSTNRRNSHEFKYRHYQEMDKGLEENIKIVEMDHAEFHNSSQTRNSYPNYHTNNDRTDHRLVPNFPPQYDYSVSEYQRISPAPSAITDMSPRTCSGHFEDYTFATAQSSPQCYSIMSRPDPSRNPFTFPRQDYAESLAYDYPLYPNYMANTQSSRAKARSQSAPKQRPDSVERQPSRRRPSIEGRNIPRAVRMQRSSSHVGSAAQNYQYPWAIKLDKSAVSLMESECGSTCSVFTNTNCARSVISYDPQGNRY